MESKLTFFNFLTASFSFLSHFFDARCICLDVNRKLINSSSNDIELPMILDSHSGIIGYIVVLVLENRLRSCVT